MDLVCDTNVWYDVGAGQYSAEAWKRQGHRLAASALTLIELASRLRPENFVRRRDAAQAVVDHADEYLTDPERHFAAVWGLTAAGTPLDGPGGYRALAAATGIADLNRGVGGMRIDTQRAEEWRRDFSGRFVQRANDFVRTLCTRHGNRRGPGSKLLLGRALRTPVAVDEVVLMTRYRAAHPTTPTNLPPVSPQELVRARCDLAPFATAYLAYIMRIATACTPKPNDWVDLHFFAYLQEGRVLVTSDEGSLAVARDAGLCDRVRHPATLQ